MVDKLDKIDIIVPVKQSITTDMKNPIIIPVKNELTNEHDLELNILANLDFFFRQLGNGFLYAGQDDIVPLFYELEQLKKNVHE